MYERSLLLNPQHENAKQALRSLRPDLCGSRGLQVIGWAQIMGALRTICQWPGPHRDGSEWNPALTIDLGRVDH
jgi:hypothetical protein